MANALLSDKEKRAAFDHGEINMEGQLQYRQQQQIYRDYAGWLQAGRYHANGGDLNFEDFFAGFANRDGGAGFNRYHLPTVITVLK